MSHKGPHEFSPNEEEKFAEIYQAHRNHEEKKVKKLIGKLTPLEEDRYDLYLRAAEKAITTSKPILNQHGQTKREKIDEDPHPSPSNNKRNRGSGGCNIV